MRKTLFTLAVLAVTCASATAGPVRKLAAVIRGNNSGCGQCQQVQAAPVPPAPAPVPVQQVGYAAYPVAMTTGGCSGGVCPK